MDSTTAKPRAQERPQPAAASALPRPAQPRVRGIPWQWLLAPACGVILLLLWELLARSGMYAPGLVPAPSRVAERWWQIATDGSLVRHTAVTLREVLTGLLIGLLAAFWLGYLTAKSRFAAYLLMPYLVAL